MAEAQPTAFADCGGPYDLTPETTLSCWEAEPTSGADLAVLAYLQSRRGRYAGKRLLHVGVGNCSAPLALTPWLGEYVGLTISQPELALFNERCGHLDNASALLMNKYDDRSYGALDGCFDVVFDTLLKSYACCDKHFQAMMEFFVSRLCDGGVIVTSERGVLFGAQPRETLAFTPGAARDPAFREMRVLGMDGLATLCERLGLTISDAPPLRTRLLRRMIDRPLILTKSRPV
jgi:hypothetical protein